MPLPLTRTPPERPSFGMETLTSPLVATRRNLRVVRLRLLLLLPSSSSSKLPLLPLQRREGAATQKPRTLQHLSCSPSSP